MKNKLISLISFVFLISSLAKKCNAQAPEPSEAYAYYTSTGSNTYGYFKVLLPSTTGISAIKVRLGTSAENYDLVDYNFLFDVSSGLPQNYSYTRINTECLLGVGAFSEPAMTFGEVILQDTNGNWGTAYKFINN